MLDINDFLCCSKSHCPCITRGRIIFGPCCWASHTSIIIKFSMIPTAYFCLQTLTKYLRKVSHFCGPSLAWRKSLLGNTHSVWKSQEMSHSNLRAKRATFTFWVDKSWLKMPKNVHFSEFLKIWSLRSNSVTRQVSFNRTKIGGKCQN